LITEGREGSESPFPINVVLNGNHRLLILAHHVCGLRYVVMANPFHVAPHINEVWCDTIVIVQDQ
jgi:hypothetical protein